MHYQSNWNFYIRWFYVYALYKNLLKPLMLIYGSQTNLSQKHLTNENFLVGLSKCGRYMLDFLDFEASELFYQILKILRCTKFFRFWYDFDFSYVYHSTHHFLASLQSKFHSLDLWQISLTFQHFLSC